MKKILAVFLLWFLPCLLIAQSTFTVIKVNGKVLSTALKREVKTGDLITTRDKLIFGDRDSYLHVFNPTQGRRTFRNIPDSSPRELMLLLEKFAAKDKTRTKSRGEAMEYAEILAEKFLADTIVVLGNGTIPVDTAKLSLKEPSAIVAEFQINGQNHKKTISDSMGFSLSRHNLFETASMTVYPRIAIWYYEDVADPLFSASSPIGNFVPLYVNEAALRSEINAIVASLKSVTKQQSMGYVVDYISQAYGAVIDENLNEWMKFNKVLQ
jgi:hypothetical protein